MCSARDGAALPAPGCPIRESAGRRPFSASPRLIAAVHALHRLLVPRHPPGALPILTVIGSDESDPVIPVSLATVQFSRSAERRTRPASPWRRAERRSGGAGRAGPSKLNSMRRPRSWPKAACVAPARFGRRSSCRGRPRDRRRAPGRVRPAVRPRALPRKEVIQPQLPLRLPCYDFTPVTSPTFDGSLPCGLGHRLRVLLTPVV